MKNTIQQPLKRKWSGPIDWSGEFHSAYLTDLCWGWLLLKDQFFQIIIVEMP